jgi:hypothetical protein
MKKIQRETDLRGTTASGTDERVHRRLGLQPYRKEHRPPVRSRSRKAESKIAALPGSPGARHVAVEK